MNNEEGWGPEFDRCALRSFIVNTKDRRLESISQVGDHWSGGVCRAVCTRCDDHVPPVEDCACGIYGCNDLEGLRQFAGYSMRYLIVVIAAEGQTLIGDVGLRTAGARIVAYWSPDRQVRSICKEVCPGAVRYKSLKDMLLSFDFPTNVTPRQSITRALSSAWFFVVLMIFCACTGLLNAMSLMEHVTEGDMRGSALDFLRVAVMASCVVVNYRIHKRRLTP